MFEENIKIIDKSRLILNNRSIDVEEALKINAATATFLNNLGHVAYSLEIDQSDELQVILLSKSDDPAIFKELQKICKKLEKKKIN